MFYTVNNLMYVENNNGEHELSVVVPAGDANDIPLALRDLVTQTDKDGNFINNHNEVLFNCCIAFMPLLLL